MLKNLHAALNLLSWGVKTFFFLIFKLVSNPKEWENNIFIHGFSVKQLNRSYMPDTVIKMSKLISKETHTLVGHYSSQGVSSLSGRTLPFLENQEEKRLSRHSDIETIRAP